MIFGVDLGVRSFHLFGVPQGEEKPLAMSFEVEKSSRWEELSALARLFSERVHFTDLVFMEEPPYVRNYRTYLGLAQTCGALTAVSLGSTYHVPVDSWKKDIVGRGGASKELVANWLAEQHQDLFIRCASNQNLMDAACLAIYGEQKYLAAHAEEAE